MCEELISFFYSLQLSTPSGSINYMCRSLMSSQVKSLLLASYHIPLSPLPTLSIFTGSLSHCTICTILQVSSISPVRSQPPSPIELELTLPSVTNPHWASDHQENSTCMRHSFHLSHLFLFILLIYRSHWVRIVLGLL